MSNWDESIKISFVLGALAVIISLVVGLAVLLNQNALNINDISASKLSQNQLRQFIKYDNRKMTGAEVAVFITKHNSTKDIGVEVFNGKSTKQYLKGFTVNGDYAVYSNSQNIESIGKISAEALTESFIKPSDLYKSRLLKNKADLIVGVKFEKQ